LCASLAQLVASAPSDQLRSHLELAHDGFRALPMLSVGDEQPPSVLAGMNDICATLQRYLLQHAPAAGGGVEARDDADDKETLRCVGACCPRRVFVSGGRVCRLSARPLSSPSVFEFDDGCGGVTKVPL
jgi:hypothetical protein